MRSRTHVSISLLRNLICVDCMKRFCVSVALTSIIPAWASAGEQAVSRGGNGSLRSRTIRRRAWGVDLQALRRQRHRWHSEHRGGTWNGSKPSPRNSSRKNNHRPLHAQIIMKCANIRVSTHMRKGYAEPRLRETQWVLHRKKPLLRGRDDEA